MDELKANKKDKKRKHEVMDSAIVAMLKNVDENLHKKEETTSNLSTENHQTKKKKKKNKKKHERKIGETVSKEDSAENSEMKSHEFSAEKKKKRKKRKKSHDSNVNSRPELNDEDSGKEESQQKKKKQKLENNIPSTQLETPNDQQEERNNYPYQVIPDDHCETPVEAYQDISPLLTIYAQSIQKDASTMLIYDPFFCEGSMVERMNQLGFANVYNRKEDFYHMKDTKQTPNYDLLLTNPPYSLDHMDRLLNYCVNEMTKPFCLLLPNYVYMKDYYPKYSKFPFIYITPKNGKRYLYTTPKGRRQQKSGKITAPFPTFWYCGRFTSAMINEFRKVSPSNVSIAFKMSDIPVEIAPDNDPRKKKLRNNLKRKKNKQRQKQNND